MRILKTLTKVCFISVFVLVILFIPSLVGGRWLIPLVLLGLVFFKFKMKKTAFIVILVVLLWASYAYGGRQGKIPGFVNRLESAILVGVNELESARMSTSENAQIVGRGFKAYIVASLASDLPANTAQAKVAEPVSPTVEARPTNTIEQDSQSCKEVTLKVKVPSANLRPNPQISESEHPLAVLQKNEEVIVTGVKGAWLKVKFFETEGWMAQTTLEPFTCKAKLP